MRAVVISVIVIAGCGGSEDVPEIEEFIETIPHRREAIADPPPALQPPETFVYRAGGRRSPFAPSSGWGADDRGTAAAFAAPDLEGSRRHLGCCPLDRIEMVGTLARRNARYGLVRAGGGPVHRVGPGDLLGEEGGRVQRVDPLAIQLLEMAPDGAGAQVERTRTVSLGGPLPEPAEDEER